MRRWKKPAGMEQRWKEHSCGGTAVPSGYAPENTMAAFEKAVEMGADGIELDVQLTKDGELVVIHDETIDRVSDGSGWVKDFTYAKLIKHNFNRTHPEYEHAQIPTLEEVYALIKPTDLTINVEIKTGVVFYPEIEERVLDLTERMGLMERVIFSSFNHYTIQKIKEINPEAETGMLYSDGIINPVSYASYVVGADALHPALYNIQYEGFMEECRRQKKKVHVWTVNEEKYMRLVCAARADAMITNYPDRGKKIAEEYSDGKLTPELVKLLKHKEMAAVMNAAGSLYFADEGYLTWQKNLVEPYLKQCQKYAYFHSYDGAAIFYQQYLAAGADTCIVISHGFSEFAEKYNEVIYYFLRQGCSVYILEHRGHGYSEREVSDDQKVYIRDFEDYIKDLDCFMKKNELPDGAAPHLICTFHGRCGRGAVYRGTSESI